MQSSEDLFFQGFDTESAYRFYESVRARLPVAEFPNVSRSINGLLEIADTIDVFVFDAFGVLNVGTTAIPGACECIQALRDMGKQVFVATNAATLPKQKTIEKFQRLGFDFSDAEIVTSRMAAETAIERKDAALWGVVGNSEYHSDDLSVKNIKLEDAQEEYDSVDSLLFLSTWAWSSARQEILEASLAKRSRPVVIANPDVIAPHETYFSTEPGFVGHSLVDRLNTQVEFHGKPFPSIFEIIQARIGTAVPASRFCMVGDTLHTDVLGGAACGWKTALVTDHGLFRGQDIEFYIRDSGIVPDFILPSI